MPVERVSKGFRDISMSFQTNPLNNDLIAIRNEAAIARSVRNLVTTYPGERPFNPYLGCDISRSLFENMDDLTADTIRSQIRETINNYEPRVRLTAVQVTPDFDNNAYDVFVVYDIVGIDVPAQQLNFVLLPNR